MIANYQILIGRLTADPEMRSTMNGKSVCNMRMACNTKMGEYEEVYYTRVEGWGWTAEQMATLKKGDGVIVVGRARTEEYTTAEGEKRSTTKVVAESIGKQIYVESKNTEVGF
jgi:single-strand DNA-binding protein